MKRLTRNSEKVLRQIVVAGQVPCRGRFYPTFNHQTTDALLRRELIEKTRVEESNRLIWVWVPTTWGRDYVELTVQHG